MKTKYYKQILTFSGLVIVILLIVLYNQYQENKIHEAYISNHVNSDMDTLVNAIIDNHNMYQEILGSEEITNHQLISLRRNNGYIRAIPQDYQYLAIQFNRLEPDKVYNETAGNAQKISGFFSDLGGREMYGLLDAEEMHDVFVELDSVLKEKIEYFHELNSFWVEAVKKNITGVKETEKVVEFSGAIGSHYGEYSLSDDFWVDLVVDLDVNTRTYLDKHKILNIEELLLKN